MLTCSGTGTTAYWAGKVAAEKDRAKKKAKDAEIIANLPVKVQ